MLYCIHAISVVHCLKWCSLDGHAFPCRTWGAFALHAKSSERGGERMDTLSVIADIAAVLSLLVAVGQWVWDWRERQKEKKRLRK